MGFCLVCQAGAARFLAIRPTSNDPQWVTINIVSLLSNQENPDNDYQMHGA